MLQRMRFSSHPHARQDARHHAKSRYSLLAARKSLKRRLANCVLLGMAGLIVFLLSAHGARAQGTDPQPVLPAASDVSPEQLVIDGVSIEKGLSDFDVWSIAQDTTGFMLFGTRHGGLGRFDGYEIKSFRHEPENANSLAHNYVWSLLVDRAGTL